MKDQKPRAKIKQDIQFTRIKQGRIYEAVVEQLQNLIVSEKLQTGDKLLPERELAQRFGVSRTAVRDAIRVLSERGLVEVKPGAGTFVVRKTSDTVVENVGLLFQIEDSPYGALQEVRAIIETEMAAIAAERATESDVKNLEKKFEEIQCKIDDAGRVIVDSAALAKADMAFHGAIADATHNSFFRHLLNPIVDLMLETQRAITTTIPEAPAQALEQYRQILESIRQKSKAQARNAMRQYMQQVAKDLETVLSQSHLLEE